MEETFLCFDVDAALFLIPLKFVHHIIPGRKAAGDPVIYNGSEVSVFDFAGLWGGRGDGCGKYVILLKGQEGLHAAAAAEVFGVFEVPEIKQRDIPEEAIGKSNIFLKKAVYMEQLHAWAYIIDLGAVIEVRDDMAAGMAGTGRY